MNNIYKYKKALVLVKDLSNIEKILERTINELLMYKKYTPAQNTLEVLQDNLLLVQVHLKQQIQIVNSKGQE
jgi:hypothetical protein